MSEWESVSPQRGTFFGWSQNTGQTLQGEVVEVGSGKDINGNAVPELTIRADVETYSFSKGEKTTVEAGELVTLTCGQSNLKKGILAASVRTGDSVRIELESLFQTEKGKAKIFDIKIRRGNGTGAPLTAAPAASPTASPWDNAPAAQSNFGDAEPPF